MKSPTTQLDFYKVGHHRQYPEGTGLVYSNFTARKASHPPFDNPDGAVFLGLQKFVQEFLIDEWQQYFFDLPEDDAVNKYARRIDTSLGPGATSYDHIRALHRLGYLPLKIKALPEGNLVPFGVPMLTVRNTLPEFYWLTNYIETVLSAELWKVCTTATIARRYKQILSHYAHKTSDAIEFVPFQCHDFSMRGVGGRHDAATSGLGHLASFVGTDNIPAIDAAETAYMANPENELIGTSIPATEHSVMSAGGQDSEKETYRRLIEDVYPEGLVSIVSDTWDFFNVIGNIARELHDVIVARDGKLVFRPDSGDPVKIITGYQDHEVTKQGGETICIKTGRRLSDLELKGAIEVLYDEFGGTINSKGYIDLDPHVGLIYGESITIARAEEICERLAQKKFASTNVVLGVGSYTYQHLTRDCFSFAVKATYCEINGEPRAIFKDPATDDGTKKSATGLLMVSQFGDGASGTYKLNDNVTRVEEEHGALETVFEDGKLYRTTTLQEIRDRVNYSLGL